MPSMKKVELSRVDNINFHSKNGPKLKKTKKPKSNDLPLEPFKQENIRNILARCVDGGDFPAIATLVAPFSKKYEVADEVRKNKIFLMLKYEYDSNIC